MIQVVLIANDPKLGKRGEIIKVSLGYANNFLIPNKKALLATPANLKVFQDEQRKQEKSDAEELTAAKDAAEKIKSLTLRIDVNAGESDKLYGAVTSQDIQERLSAQGIKLDRKDIQLEEPIRRLGAYEVSLRLHPQVPVKLKISVVKK